MRHSANDFNGLSVPFIDFSVDFTGFAEDLDWELFACVLGVFAEMTVICGETKVGSPTRMATRSFPLVPVCSRVLLAIAVAESRMRSIAAISCATALSTASEMGSTDRVFQDINVVSCGAGAGLRGGVDAVD